MYTDVTGLVTSEQNYIVHLSHLVIDAEKGRNFLTVTRSLPGAFKQFICDLC
jgi:hypothetical protein